MKRKDIAHFSSIISRARTVNDEFNVRVAHSLEEACKLLEVGFEYVTEMDGARIFRKRK